MIEIPVFQNSSADFTEEIELGGVVVTIRIVYNIRNEFFHFRLTVGNDNICGLKCVVDFPLLFAHKAQVQGIDGDFIILNDDGTVSELTYDNFGSSYKLYYMTDSEFEDWKTENGI